MRVHVSTLQITPRMHPSSATFCWIDECHTNIIGLAFVCIIDRARPLVLAERSEAVDDLQAEHWPAAFINVGFSLSVRGRWVCGSIGSFSHMTVPHNAPWQSATLTFTRPSADSQTPFGFAAIAAAEPKMTAAIANTNVASHLHQVGCD